MMRNIRNVKLVHQNAFFKNVKTINKWLKVKTIKPKSLNVLYLNRSRSLRRAP